MDDQYLPYLVVQEVLSGIYTVVEGCRCKERIQNRRGIVSGDNSSGKYLVWFGSYTGGSKHRETLRVLRPQFKDVFKGRREM